MATEEDGSIDSLVSIICKDPLERRNFKSKCEEFLTKVSVPAGWEDTEYRLHQENPTYKYRQKILTNFVHKRVSEGFTVKSGGTKQFSDELQKFSELSESDESFYEFWSSKRPASPDLLQLNIRLCGPVVWKSDTELKASVLIQTKGHYREDGKLSFTEHIIDLQNESKEGYDINVGDIVEVTKCRRNNEVALEPEVIKCYYLDQNKIDSFLELVLNCVETEGSTAAVTELSRCHAVWDYILNLSTEKYTSEMALQILSILDKICSSAQKQMSHTVSKIVTGFQQSVFFTSFLPGFIEKMTDKSTISVVQSILEHVVNAIPASGPKVLPMAKVISQNLVNGSCDLQTAKENGQSAIGFLSKLSTILALNLPEALEDVQSLQWKDLPLIPVVREIHKPSKFEQKNKAGMTTDDLPIIRKQGKYSTEEEYLNTNFRLLREECFYKLRKGIHDFVTSGNKHNFKEAMMYRITLRGVSTKDERSPTVMLLSLKYEVPDGVEWESEGQFLYGNLLCISIDGYFEEPVWALVEGHIDRQRVVKITLCDEANKISEAEFIVRMQELRNRNKRAFMAESQTFYRAFAPAMDVLQHKDHVPFKEFLVYPDPNYMEPAEYINEIKSPPDWDIIFQGDSLPEREKPSDYSLLKDFERIRLNSSCKSKLDETQLSAVELALKNKLVLIQGPPGTGKSFVGVALVHLLLSMNVPQNYGPILVVTYKNHALDNFLLDCIKKVSSPDVKIVRVGRVPEDADSRLTQCSLHKVGGPWPERLFRQKRKLQGRIWGMQPEVRRAFEKLRCSSIFNAFMFLEEASDAQTRSLLVDNENQTVDRAEVETLLKEKDLNHRSMSRLRELVEEALKKWLPSQELFDGFAGGKDVSEKETRSAGITKQKSKDEQDQENPNDFRDPSVEQKERLGAVDKDEEEEGIVHEDTELKNPVSDARMFRELICVDEAKVKPYKNLLDAVKVWELDENERVQLVYVFQSKNYEKASHEFRDVSSEYTQIHHQFKELRNQHDIEVMKACDVIGMTVTGATLRANILADIKPAVMVVEEAAEILEGQLVAVIPPSVQHLIMIGDHKQLRPVVYYHRLKKHHNLDLSMFERLINCKVPYMQLGFQCRMRDEIVDLLRELKIYSSLRTNHELVRGNVLPACVGSSMYFYTHTAWESESKDTSKRNTREALEITEVAKTFCLKGKVLPSKITVLCSYRGQVLEIREQFKKNSALADISITTIDSFQGQENDIILISLVRSNREGTIGYLSSMNRLCVAISRARCGLYLFGNHAHLAKASRKGWKVVADFMWKKKCRGSKFPFGDNPKSALHSESQFEGISDTRENPASSTTIHANEATIIIGGDNSVNTITTSPGNPASGTRPPRLLEMSISPSGKVPVHDPKSPTAQDGSPIHRMEGGDGNADKSPGFVPVQVAGREGLGADGEHAVEATKEARMPTQVTPEAEKSSPDLSEIEEAKERPVQESHGPKSSIRDSTITDKEFREGGKEARQPTQETLESEKPSLDLSEMEKTKERPVSPQNSITEKTVADEDFMADDKEARQPIQTTSEAEKSSADVSELETLKEKPVQESENPKSSTVDTPTMEDEPTKEAPVQESEETTAKKDELKEHPERGVRQVYQEGDIKPLVEDRPLQELEDTTSKDSKVENEDQRDGKGEQCLQESRELGKEQRTEAEDTRQVTEEEEAHEELSEGKPLQESASSDAGTKTCKEEALPTQETMPAGKGPFEETGLEVGVKGQASVSEGKPLQVSSGSDVQTKTCKDEPLPTQETMPAGKGPFEESGLEVGVKGQPSDDQE